MWRHITVSTVLTQEEISEEVDNLKKIDKIPYVWVTLCTLEKDDFFPLTNFFYLSSLFLNCIQHDVTSQRLSLSVRLKKNRPKLLVLTLWEHGTQVLWVCICLLFVAVRWTGPWCWPGSSCHIPPGLCRNRDAVSSGRARCSTTSGASQFNEHHLFWKRNNYKGDPNTGYLIARFIWIPDFSVSGFWMVVLWKPTFSPEWGKKKLCMRFLPSKVIKWETMSQLGLSYKWRRQNLVFSDPLHSTLFRTLVPYALCRCITTSPTSALVNFQSPNLLACTERAYILNIGIPNQAWVSPNTKLDKNLTF